MENISKSGVGDFYIVGIGASAGGLEALEKFFLNMPPTSNMAFVVIQHLSPDYKSLMSELLSKHAKMPVYQIRQGMEILTGSIYLNPPGYNVTISKDQLLLTEQDPTRKINLAVDHFFDSLALDKKEKSIGIILSGTGSDGTRGCRTIKEAGGLIIAQDDKSARFNGMPKSVIAANICDFILEPSLMPEKLLAYTRQTSLMPETTSADRKIDEDAGILPEVYDILKEYYSIDFSLYKQNTVLRCIERRIRICQSPSLKEYLTYLKENADEVESLYNSLLIGVTRFFRDREAFEAVKNKVLPEIFADRTENSAIRVWVAGCSTGEEAYSLAILFKEYMEEAQKNFNIKIFATDVDNKAIEYASAGAYPDSISGDVSLERLNRYFIKKKDVYLISRTIREMVIFSIHNVINNPPFHKIDLLSCRNLLIYFQPKLQARILMTFQFALETGGFLLLGTSEATGEISDNFTTVDSKWKIFKCRNANKRTFPEELPVLSAGLKVIPSRNTDNYLSRIARSTWEMEDIYANLIEECLPPSVVVDEYGELIQVCGDGDRYLKVPKGRASFDIQKMVPNELSAAVGTAISKVRKDKKAVTYANIKIRLSEEQIWINLLARPLFTKKNGLLILVIFEENKKGAVEPADAGNFDIVSELYSRISDLEQALQYTKESLQTSVEKNEMSSEELQSSNEELLVSNEELHSTNEELQLVNEELIAMNTQYQYKIQELADLNNDMTNFLNSTDIGTIFLDLNLCVRRFTPSVTKEINLLEQDIGRPIGHISHNLVNEDLVHEAGEVLNSLVPVEKGLQSATGKWYLAKYSPFRTREGLVMGVVISLVDITARQEAEIKLHESEELYEKLMEFDALKNDFFSNLSHELRTPLNVIMSTLQLLDAHIKNSPTNEKHDLYIKKHLNIMKQNCFRQLRLVNNMIDITKIDAGFFEVRLHNHNIVSVVENITLSVSEYIRNKSLELIFDTDFEEKIIACDPDNIERIMLNLLSNAVKFTREGGSINVSMYDKGDRVLISVRDTGIGIPKEKQDIIFDRFRQVDRSLTKNNDGSGIGLSLVKSLVELHGGMIYVQSEYGEGSEFIIELPARTVPEDASVVKEDDGLKHNVEKIHIEFSDIYNLN